MPRQIISAGETNNLSNFAEKSDNEKRLTLKKCVGALAVGLTAVGAGLFMSEGVAQASGYDVAIIVGGAGDGTSQGLEHELWNNGTLYQGEEVIDVNYPAQMGPIVGNVPTNQSVAMGISAVEASVYAHSGADITLYGFSEGAFVTNGAAADLANQGIYVNVMNSGDGNGSAGILASPIAQSFKPITDSLGIQETPPVPGTVEKLDANDVWASNAAGDIGKIINDGLNIQNHRVISPSEVPDEAFTENGVTYLVYDGTIPVPQGATLVPIPPEYR
ncbi:MAG: PE-PPE domain-containing protein [Candidatus Nomurabacteria bacterium]|nr:MAG: PE-PPE domain-containing protein [Candidatus Nomurabacteria bacterium]